MEKPTREPKVEGPEWRGTKIIRLGVRSVGEGLSLIKSKDETPPREGGKGEGLVNPSKSTSHQGLVGLASIHNNHHRPTQQRRG